MKLEKNLFKKVKNVFTSSPTKETSQRWTDLSLSKNIRPSSFELQQVARYGGPGYLTTCAYNPSQKLFAVGTSYGVIIVLGKNGATSYIELPELVSVRDLFFKVDSSKLFCIDELNQLNVYDLATFQELYLYPFKDTITCYELIPFTKWLILGFKSGYVQLFDTEFSRLSYYTIPNTFKLISKDRKFKQVSQLKLNPQNLNQLLIAYRSGIIVLWDIKSKKSLSVFDSTLSVLNYDVIDQGEILIQIDLNTLCWKPDGSHFIVGFKNGVFSIWNIEDNEKPIFSRSVYISSLEETVIPSDFNESIMDILWCSTEKKDESVVIISGGPPIDNLKGIHAFTFVEDRYEIPKKFTSVCCHEEILQIGLISNHPWIDGCVNPNQAFILGKNNFFKFIDLDFQNYGIYPPNTLHWFSSQPIFSNLLVDNPDVVFRKLLDLHQENFLQQNSNLINGGVFSDYSPTHTQRDLIITIEEPACIRFWTAHTIYTYELTLLKLEIFNIIQQLNISSSIILVSFDKFNQRLILAFQNGIVISCQIQPEITEKIVSSDIPPYILEYVKKESQMSEVLGNVLSLITNSSSDDSRDEPSIEFRNKETIDSILSSIRFVSKDKTTSSDEAPSEEQMDRNSVSSVDPTLEDARSTISKYLESSLDEVRPAPSYDFLYTIHPEQRKDLYDHYTVFAVHDTSITCLTLSRNDLLAIGDEKGLVSLFSLSSLQLLFLETLDSPDFPEHADQLEFIRIDSSDSTMKLLVGTNIGSVHVYNMTISNDKLDITKDISLKSNDHDSIILLRVFDSHGNIQNSSSFIDYDPVEPDSSCSNDSQTNTSFLLICSSTRITIHPQLSQLVLSAIHFDKEDSIIKAEVIQHHNDLILVCITSSGFAYVYSLPYLIVINSIPLREIYFSKKEKIQVTQEGRIYMPTGRTEYRQFSIFRNHPILTSALAQSFSPHDPSISCLEHPGNASKSWIPWTSTTLTEEIDQIAQKDLPDVLKPRARPMQLHPFEIPKPVTSVSLEPGASNQSSSGSSQFHQTQKNLQERSERLMNLDQKFSRMEEASKDFLEQIKEYNNKQDSKKWYEL